MARRWTGTPRSGTWTARGILHRRAPRSGRRKTAGRPLAAGIPSVDIIDFDFPAWHTAKDTLDAVSARSLQIVGDVLLAALPQIEARLR